LRCERFLESLWRLLRFDLVAERAVLELGLGVPKLRYPDVAQAEVEAVLMPRSDREAVFPGPVVAEESGN